MISEKLNLKLKYHVWFWGLYFISNFLRWGSYFNDYGYSFQSNVIEFSLHIPLVYFNLFVLFPRFVLQSKYYQYVIALLLSLFIIYFFKTGLTYFLISENIWPEANRAYKPFDINHIVAVCIGELYVVSIASSIYLILIWIKERGRNQALQKSQMEIKLKYLKAQIQPHFFFNTLNNLYALSLESSKELPIMIIKLSKLMEYVLYDIEGAEFVPLIKELEYMQNYIDIEKLRFPNAEISFNIESSIENKNIPPLLFITLLENSFKHGGVKNNNLKIRINCRISQEYLHFEIINNFVHSPVFKAKKRIGLINIKSRLELIFASNFTLKQYIKFNYYIVCLKIPIRNEH